MSIPQLTEALIRQNADSKSFARGKDYYHEGAVIALVRRSEIIEAEVEGSDVEPYEVSARLLPDGGIEADCTCPYDWGGWCKHIVAALLACLHEPETVEERPPLASLLSPLDRDTLQTLLLRLAERKHGLTDEIAAEVEKLQFRPSPAPAAEGTPSQAAPIDPAAIRKQIRKRMKEIGRGGGGYGYDDYGDEYDGAADLEDEVGPLIESAEELVKAGDSRRALSLLEAVTDELVSSWDLVEDVTSDGSELFDDLGRIWAEVILTADLDKAERATWASTLNKWRRKGEYSGADDGLAAAVGAAEQGWDYPPLVRVLQGEITDKGAWEDEAPDWGDMLAVARINVLEWQGRLQEAAYVAEAESQSDRYMELLVKMGRAQEAIDYGLKWLDTTDSALLLAQTLREQGETAHALRITEHGLQLQGAKRELGIWLRDFALIQGKTDLAIQAAMTALKESPRLDDYAHLQGFAGARWPELREEMLAFLRTSGHYDISGKVDIFLHEGLMEEALNAVKGSWNYDLVARVVEAATPTLPNEVIPVCTAQAEAIMNAGKADRYHYAAEWVQRARDAYRAAGREADWQGYKEDLLTLHQRKYKLRPMLEAL